MLVPPAACLVCQMPQHDSAAPARAAASGSARSASNDGFCRSKRKTSSQVAYISGERLLGEEAAVLQPRFPNRVYTQVSERRPRMIPSSAFDSQGTGGMLAARHGMPS